MGRLFPRRKSSDSLVLEPCQRALKYRFNSEALLINALTHRSMKSSEKPSNERLEFLGDSVLGLLSAHCIYEYYPDLAEGEMTALRALWVSTDSLAETVKKMGLGSYLYLGKGILQGGEIPASVLANAFEAVLAAIYLDGGIEAAQGFLEHFLFKEKLKKQKKNKIVNYKTLLQQETQARFSILPRYQILSETGPHHEREYQISVVIQGVVYPAGRGKTKKIAEQMAAQFALHALGISS